MWPAALWQGTCPSRFRLPVGDRDGHSQRLHRSQAGTVKGVLAMLKEETIVVTVGKSFLAVMMVVVSTSGSCVVGVVGIKAFHRVELDDEIEAAELKAEQYGSYP